MHKVILLGSEKMQNMNYDKLFSLLHQDSCLPKHMTTSVAEYKDGVNYIVELKMMPQAVATWIESNDFVDSI